MSSILYYNRFLIVAFIMLCSGLLLATPPTCPPCQYWYWYEEEDYGECLDCDEVGMECCNEECYSTETHICCGGTVITKCDSDECMECDGQGNCVSKCDSDECMECDGQGNCVSKCDSNYCMFCDGAGTCEDRSSPITNEIELESCENTTADPDYIPSSNGCGSESTSWIPDNPTMEAGECGGEITDFRPACDYHDVCYGTCGIEKSQCDSDFGDLMLKICHLADLDEECLDKCLSYQSSYVLGVSFLGDDAFLQAQIEACNCCDGLSQ